MKKILINIPSQFGYHTDTYMYCKYLDKQKYKVHYIGFDSGMPIRGLDNSAVKIHSVQVQSNKFKNYWNYLKAINKLIRTEKFDLVFQVDHKLTLLVRLCNLYQKFILDIRTGDLSSSKIKRTYFNFYIYFTSLFYKNITVISESLANKLHIPTHKRKIIGLGAEVRNVADKNWNELHLFYIGTLQHRNIWQTIEGLATFIQNNPTIVVSYDIVGMGTQDDLLMLNKTIHANHLRHIVTYHGQKSHTEINEIWEKSNVGVVYVPITPYYDCQPSTKLYEYVLAGMAVIATNTFENQLEIDNESGVLIDDTASAFANGLEQLSANRILYNSGKQKYRFINSTWENIVNMKLDPYFVKLIAK